MGRSSTRTSDRAAALAALAALAAVAGGCGSPGPRMEPVTGEVLYNGRPVARARVTFLAPAAARPAVGTTDAAGRFTLSTMADGDGALVGEHRVAITTFTPEAVARMSPARQEALGRGEKVPGSGLPPRYASAEKSGLSAAVEAGGKNHFRFDLTD